MKNNPMSTNYQETPQRTTPIPPRWLAWAREILAISQNGLAYNKIEYDRERYRRLQEIAAEILESHTGLDAPSLVKEFSMQPGYATPKVDVRAAVVKDGKILLVQEQTDQKWSLPGGWADVGDYPAQVAEREVWEESGFEVKARKLIGVYDCNRIGEPLAFYHAYKLIFLCDLTGGEARTSHETLAVKFFHLDELPPLSWQRTNTRHVHDIQAHLNDPTRPAAFD